MPRPGGSSPLPCLDRPPHLFTDQGTVEQDIAVLNPSTINHPRLRCGLTVGSMAVIEV